MKKQPTYSCNYIQCFRDGSTERLHEATYATRREACLAAYDLITQTQERLGKCRTYKDNGDYVMMDYGYRGCYKIEVISSKQALVEMLVYAVIPFTLFILGLVVWFILAPKLMLTLLGLVVLTELYIRL